MKARGSPCIRGVSDTTSTNLLNLDRPVDIAFACDGGLRITNGEPPPTRTSGP